MTNPLLELQRYGQSVWLDYIHRSLLASGELEHLMVTDGIRGVTSNPSILEKAIVGSDEYEADVRRLARQGKNAQEIYETLAIRDIRWAADILRPLYDETDGGDGFVSIEVSPHLAYDTEGTIAEARRLFRTLDRPNVMIKVPATVEGLPAITQLISEGININVTLVFALERYQQVAEAYIAGLERLEAAEKRDGQAKRLLSRVASVASFFVSRIDTAVDAQLQARFDAGDQAVASLLGKAAIASAKVAYARFKEIFDSPRFAHLRARGARVQRPLWASTSTKNPAYSDVRYIEELIGPHTVNTIPPVTLAAFRDHGQVRPTLEEGVGEAREVLARLGDFNIELSEITQYLEDQGVRLFAQAFDKLIASLRTNAIAVAPELEKTAS
ncbi:MAG TPA: transaldolase [Anaerolineae bacterium]|nr:transaldolase [Anaerolineae bacterium]